MNAKISALLFSCLTFSAAGWAADHAEHKPRDMSASWAAALARAPLAVSVAFDAEGGVWRAAVSAGHVTVSHSGDKGSTWGAPVMVNPQAEFVAAEGENRPKIAVARNGNIYVSWTRSSETPYAGDIRFSRSTDGGQTFSAPLTVNDNLDPITHRFEAMGINSQGQVYLAWLDRRDAAAAKQRGKKFTGLSVYYAVSDDEGLSFGTNKKAAEHSCECCRVAIAIDTDGAPVIAWRHIFGKNTRDHALLRLDGKSQPVRLSRDNWELDACPHHGPALSIADDGVYHAVWFNNAEQRHGLFYANSANRGRTFPAPLNFGNFNRQAAHPHVLSLGRQVVIVWKEFDGETTGILRMNSADGGRTWTAPVRIASTAGPSDHPLLAGDGASAYLSWNSVAEGHRVIAIPLTREQAR
ncbi:MAG TPA: sialidase family protein [Gallionella sp.]